MKKKISLFFTLFFVFFFLTTEAKKKVKASSASNNEADSHKPLAVSKSVFQRDLIEKHAHPQLILKEESKYFANTSIVNFSQGDVLAYVTPWEVVEAAKNLS